MNKFMRKGQAAMEFLMTYGWALLIVLVVIGALAYFGLLNPDRFLPDKAELSPEIVVRSVAANASAVVFVLSNSAGRALYNFNLTIPQCTGGTAFTVSSNSYVNDAVFPDGETQKLIVNCTHSFANNTKFKSDVYVNYTTKTNRETIPHSKVGVVRVRVGTGVI